MNETVLDGALLLAIPVAAFAGLISFFSPCVLPLVPGYLGYVTGLSGADLRGSSERGGGALRGRMLLGSLLFVLGFSVVFVSAGALFGYFAFTLQEHITWITRVLGALTIVLGLSFAGLLPRLGFLQREARLDHRPTTGLVGAPVLGFVFGLGWTPCIGPTQQAVFALSVSEADAGRGALLGLCYCLGLGIPFMVAAVAFRRALGAFGWVKRHYQWVMRTGGAMLVVVGVLLITGVWNRLVYEMQLWTSGFTIGI
ncbi:cytochrome c biogenesis CcdA family protein [Allostreptomyces psammosilenae]|uniref:Cytochrome c-type biogenesis protein n=1 Tax=Allostreptomyces psammosilenae TaxID=1892865 RepID=A0A853A5L1_9ACTN|nr:cytochrome c biogenesis protein CcdA [Allostreptomyces psammosilenae]NYI05782.1 cytochrome c-type biogenesis protein [Allostreptomyces psammosilenae]